MNRPGRFGKAFAESAFRRRLLAAGFLALCLHAWLLFGWRGPHPVSAEDAAAATGLEIRLSYAQAASAEAASSAQTSSAPPDEPPVAAKQPAREPRPEPLPPPPARRDRRAAAPENPAGALRDANSSAGAEADKAPQAAAAEAATPRRQDNPKPVYPELARRRGQEGTVLLQVSVDAQGRPLAVSIARSSGHRLLDDAAVRAVEKWLFNPARQDGAAVPGQVRLPVDFRLTN